MLQLSCIFSAQNTTKLPRSSKLHLIPHGYQLLSLILNFYERNYIDNRIRIASTVYTLLGAVGSTVPFL
jgi:hypothetical protein